MFSGKSRPIPSKGALRVLYQLAYISSGTVVGVATLCAEERRRRIAIVQKIADNAKSVRQSPRHVQSAARARVDQAEHKLLAEESGDDSEDVLLKRAAKTIVLPSEVEKTYKRISKKERATRQSSGRRHEPIVEQNGLRDPANKPARGTTRSRPRQTKAPRSSHGSDVLDAWIKQRLEPEQELRPARPRRTSLGLDRSAKTQNFAASVQDTEIGPFLSPLEPPSPLNYQGSEQEQQMPRSRAPATPSRDVELPFGDPALPNQEFNHENTPRVRLVDALKLNSLETISRFVHEKLNAGRFGESDLSALDTSMEALSGRANHDESSNSTSQCLQMNIFALHLLNHKCGVRLSTLFIR